MLTEYFNQITAVFGLGDVIGLMVLGWILFAIGGFFSPPDPEPTASEKALGAAGFVAAQFLGPLGHVVKAATEPEKSYGFLEKLGGLIFFGAPICFVIYRVFWVGF